MSSGTSFCRIHSSHESSSSPRVVVVAVGRHRRHVAPGDDARAVLAEALAVRAREEELGRVERAALDDRAREEAGLLSGKMNVADQLGS